jgi:hypothetical protein
MSSELEAAVAELRETLESSRRELESWLARRFPDELMRPKPHEMRDQHGRFLLLDAQTALVNGLAALER